MDSSSTSSPEKTQGGTQSLPRAYLVRSERERLLEAMVRVAAAKGYEATTVTDVIEVAGVSRAGLRRDVRRQGGLLPRGLRRGLRRPRRPRDQRLRGRRRASPGRSGSPPALGALVELLSIEADIARLSMVEVTAAGRRRPRSLPRGAGPLHPVPRGRARVRQPGRGAARRHRPLRDRRRHLDDLRRDPRRARTGADAASSPTSSSPC